MPETIDSLSINIASSSGSAVRNIDELTSSLKQLDFTTKNGFSGLASLSRQLDKIQKRLSSFQPSSLAQFNEMSKSISALNGVKISSSISNQIKSIADSSILLNGVDFSGLETLSTSFEKITALPKSNLASTVNQLKKLPEVAKDLHSLDLDEFAADITKITTALAPLSEQLSKCSSGISNFTNSAKKLEQVSVGMSKQSSGFGFSTMSPLSFFIGYHAIKKNAIERIIRNIGERSMITRIHPHLFRATYATNMLKKGVDIQVIAKLLGHSKIETTSMYICLSDDEMEQIAGSL